MKKILILTLFSLIVVANSGCTRAFKNVLGLQSAAKGTPQMETFKPKHSHLEVVMPGPRDEVASFNDLFNSTYMYKHEEGFYALSFGLVMGVLMTPDQFQASLNDLSSKLVKSIDGTPTMTTPIQYYGAGCAPDAFRQGKEIEGTIGSGDRYFKLRVYLIGTTEFKSSYCLVVCGTKSFVNSPEANRFLGSLKLLEIE